MTENKLTEPLLEKQREAEHNEVRPSQQHEMNDDAKKATEESPKLRDELEDNPSYEPLNVRPQLEYEPENSATGEINAETEDDNPQEIKFTTNEPVWQTCPYCNTTAETTTINAFGRCTCLWVCILLVVCFPLCWLPFLWKDVSTWLSLFSCQLL